MIIPILCQTCGEPIGHLWKKYVESVQKYARLDKERGQKAKESPEYRARQELIDQHGLDGRRQCCLYAFPVNYDASDQIS